MSIISFIKLCKLSCSIAWFGKLYMMLCFYNNPFGLTMILWWFLHKIVWNEDPHFQLLPLFFSWSIDGRQPNPSTWFCWFILKQIRPIYENMLSLKQIWPICANRPWYWLNYTNFRGFIQQLPKFFQNLVSLICLERQCLQKQLFCWERSITSLYFLTWL